MSQLDDIAREARFYAGRSAVRRRSSGLTEAFRLQDENNNLRRQLAEAQLRARLAEAEAENAKLRATLADRSDA